MSQTILKIGNTDLSESVEQSGVTITSRPIYGDIVFRAVTGQEKKKCIGTEISISANFTYVPECEAKAIVSACNADKVTISYLDPNAASAVFDRPSISASPLFEESDGTVAWTISLSASCPFKPGESL